MCGHVVVIFKEERAKIGFTPSRAPLEGVKTTPGPVPPCDNAACRRNLGIISEAEFGCVSAPLEVNQP